MTTDIANRTRAVVHIPMASFKEEYLNSVRPPQHGKTERDQEVFRRSQRVFETFDLMGGIETTADLNPTPEFVDRFLKASGIITSRTTIRSVLNFLSLALLYAVAKGYHEASKLVITRPIPIPPAWDEAVGTSATAVRAGPPSAPCRIDPGQAPEWDDFARVMAALAKESFAWPKGLLYALCANVVLAQLMLKDALAIGRDDYKPDAGMLRIDRRDRMTKPSSPPFIEIPRPLIQVNDRWRPRVHSRHFFPRLERDAPWDKSISRFHLARFARKVLGEGDAANKFTFSGLLGFGGIHAVRLAHPSESPFAIGPLDAETLMPRVVTIEGLKEHLGKNYGNPRTTNVSGSGYIRQKGSVYWCRRIFAIIEEQMPDVVTTADLTPEFLARFKIIAGISEQRTVRDSEMLDWLRTFCGHAIDLGGPDLDPFMGTPEIAASRPSEPTPVTRRTYIYQHNAVELIALARDSASTVEPRRCPAELRGRNAQPLVYGQEVPILTRAEYNLLDVLILAFIDGIDGYSREDLVKQTKDEAPWRTYAEMRKKPEYEPWQGIMPERKEAKRGELFRLVDPREGNW
jgi:hypothetical protein